MTISYAEATELRDMAREVRALRVKLNRALIDYDEALATYDRSTILRPVPGEPGQTVPYLIGRKERIDLPYWWAFVVAYTDQLIARTNLLTALTSYYEQRANGTVDGPRPIPQQATPGRTA